METYIVNANLHKLSDQIFKLTEAVDQISLKNRKLRNELVIKQNVNTRLEEKMINLEKNLAEEEQYSRKKKVEVSRIPNSIFGEELGNTVISICKECE